MDKIRVERNEGHLRLVISEELLKTLQVSEGDDVLVSSDASGLHLTVQDEKAHRVAKALEECNRDYGDTLRDLAK